MSSRSERYAIGLAGPEDSEQLLRLYECGGFAGAISVKYTRRPDAYASLSLDGDRVVIPIVTDTRTGVIVGMGACVIRRAYVNGKIMTTGYLTGLKGLPEYRMRVPLIPEMYKYLWEHTKDEVALYYTTILEENAAVRKMLEKRRRNMPEYRARGRYTVHCLRAGGRMPGRDAAVQRGSRAELAKLLADEPGRFNLTPVDADLPGLDEVYLLRGRNGEIEAACGIWNQQAYKQHIVTGYAGVYRHLRRLPYRLFGYPNLPPENTVANCASIALLAVRDNDPRLAGRFLRRVAATVRGYDFLTLGLFENHPLTAAVSGIRSFRYGSRLYTVHWEGGRTELDDRPVHLEVGLL